MTDLKKMNDNDLLKQLKENQEKSRVFRFSVIGGKIKNIRDARNFKKNIARILTEIQLRKNNNLKIYGKEK